MPETLTRLERGELTPRPQDESEATYAPDVAEADRAVRWKEEPGALDRRVRAVFSAARKRKAFCRLPEEMGAKRLSILEAEVSGSGGWSQDLDGAEPGEVLEASGRRGLLVAAGRGRPGAVRLVNVQPEGGRAMPAAAFLRGHRLAPGMRLLDGLQVYLDRRAP
jgi:methionyl-tRNA formyltransferase